MSFFQMLCFDKFYFFKIFLLDQGPFWTSCDPPHGLQSQGGSEPKGHIWCYACLFHLPFLGCTLYKQEYSRPAFQTSLMQAAESRQWWMLTFGSSEIRSHAARSTNKHAIHSATPAGLINFTSYFDFSFQFWVSLRSV